MSTVRVTWQSATTLGRIQACSRRHFVNDSAYLAVSRQASQLLVGGFVNTRNRRIAAGPSGSLFLGNVFERVSRAHLSVTSDAT